MFIVGIDVDKRNHVSNVITFTKGSLVIAEVICFGRYATSYVPQEKLLALKELYHNRSYLMDLSSDLKRKTVAPLDRVFPEYEAQFDSVFCKSSLAVLNKYPTPQKLVNANLTDMCLLCLLWRSRASLSLPRPTQSGPSFLHCFSSHKHLLYLIFFA